MPFYFGKRTTLNIFETIGSVTGGIEQYHSQFLADALRASLSEDRSLFDGIWCLATPKGWEPPDCAEISTEEAAGEGRIDICIKSDHPVKRIVGIEVKTRDESVESGQLDKYFDGLRGEFREYCVQVSYLTPFNRGRAGDVADKLPAVEVYERFREEASAHSRHLSWLDVADICWDGNDLWKQHQAYVHKHISSCSNLKESSVDRDRGLDAIFGKEPARGLLDKLAALKFQPEGDRMGIDLSTHCGNLSSFAENLVDALQILLKADRVSRDAKRTDKFTDGQREPFFDSPYRDVHEALFGLSKQFCHVWLQGDGNYGVRTAHKDHPSSGVSLVTSQSHDRLVVVLRR